jgi:uncharacterized protein (TIGR00730 family)
MPKKLDPHCLIKRVSFFGDAQTPKNHQDYQDAYETAKLLGELGYTIVNGGGPGIMDASTQGAESVGGTTTAVTFAPKHAGSFEGRYLKNLSQVNKEVITGNYIERMFGLIEESDAFIIFRGGSGTISEFGTVWVMANIYYGHQKPFLLFGSHWWQIIDVLQNTMNIDAQEMNCFKIVETKEEALQALQQFEWEFSQVDHSGCKHCAEHAVML